jgi:hypothetical protein
MDQGRKQEYLSQFADILARLDYLSEIKHVAKARPLAM